MSGNKTYLIEIVEMILEGFIELFETMNLWRKWIKSGGHILLSGVIPRVNVKLVLMSYLSMTKPAMVVLGKPWQLLMPALKVSCFCEVLKLACNSFDFRWNGPFNAFSSIVVWASNSSQHYKHTISGCRRWLGGQLLIIFEFTLNVVACRNISFQLACMELCHSVRILVIFLVINFEM